MDNNKNEKQQTSTFSLRCPVELKDQLDAVGEDMLWSRNQVIVQALKLGLPLLSKKGGAR